MLSDPIADLLTRIRNANLRNHAEVAVPFSKIKQNVVDVLAKEGFIHGSSVREGKSFNEIVIQLKYDPDGERVIRKIERISKPGLRVYQNVSKIKPVLNGQGIAVVSTSKGVLSDRECREQKAGGEVLCHVW